MRNMLTLAGILTLVGACSGGAGPAVDTTRDGTYQEGRWEYRYRITNQGTRSEGYHGELVYDGQPVADPAGINDFYKTPWGPMYWVGKPVVAFGGHGWMTRPKASQPAGKELTPGAAAAPKIMGKVLVEGAAGAKRETDKQIVDELSKLGVKDPVVEQDWFPLTSEPHAIHDTKRFGWHRVHFAGVKDGKAQIVMEGGVIAYKKTVELAVKGGETLCLKQTIGGPLDEANIYVVFRVLD